MCVWFRFTFLRCVFLPWLESPLLACVCLFLPSGRCPCVLGGMKRKCDKKAVEEQGELVKNRAKCRRAFVVLVLCYVCCLTSEGLSVALWRCSISFRLTWFPISRLARSSHGLSCVRQRRSVRGRPVALLLVHVFAFVR